MVPLFTWCILVVLHWWLQQRNFQIFLQEVITTISYFLIAETYLINRWYNPNIAGKKLYIHCLETLFLQTIPASLQYILLITLYTIHILADVLIQEQGSKSYPFQNWWAKYNEQKRHSLLNKTTLWSKTLKQETLEKWQGISYLGIAMDTELFTSTSPILI